MIAAFMLHALAVGMLCAAGAWALERAFAQIGAPRRAAWALGMLASVSIPLAALIASADGSSAPVVVATHVSGVGQPQGAAPLFVMDLVQLPAMSAHRQLDRAVACLWLVLSLAVFAAYFVTTRRLARRARNWSRLFPTRDDVLLADDLGPAVFGLLRPRVVLPRWLSAASAGVQKLVLAHERQHVAARDPQLLGLALVLAAVFPWNLPLLWQLRRLRFALEVDCDARVLGSQADPTEYGEALLVVSQRASAAPAGAIALIERPSQLEQRIEIMTAAAHRFRKAIASAALGLAVLCVIVATSITAPALAAADAPLKPTPSGDTVLKLGQHFERMLGESFPGLLEQDLSPHSMLVVLLNQDWSIAKAVQVTGGNDEEIPADKGTFGVLGIAKDAVPYVGAMRLQSPKNSAHWVNVIYTERTTPGQRFVSHVFPETLALDRQIFRRYFPEAAKNGVAAGLNPWVLLDREGHVLRNGQDVADAQGWNKGMESRFAGIRTQEITVTAITDDAGQPVNDAAGQALQLISVWLAPDSPLPPT